jgi:hypothetical protein
MRVSSHPQLPEAISKPGEGAGAQPGTLTSKPPAAQGRILHIRSIPFQSCGIALCSANHSCSHRPSDWWSNSERSCPLGAGANRRNGLTGLTIKMKILDVPQSGTQGTTVRYKTRFGQPIAVKNASRGV